jgi:hypothetical protein
LYFLVIFTFYTNSPSSCHTSFTVRRGLLGPDFAYCCSSLFDITTRDIHPPPLRRIVPLSNLLRRPLYF